ncbi:peroxiredoxin [Sorangium sp. So ce295]|uniref:peroxiredoxin n=1 Tax=Sorangium sp. So ce295 TaxID=3133295 RepID=UPI003F63BC62
MVHDVHDLPEGLPVPQDDGGSAHLPGIELPSIPLMSTEGTNVDLSRVGGKCVVFAYPRTGVPGQAPLVDSWNDIPGARGCTPQTCGFRDRFAELRELGVTVYGLSTQSTEYQREMAGRLRLPFPVLSDFALRLTEALRLPTFEVAGVTLLRRLAWYAEDGAIRKVFYPVFPPDQNAEMVLEWLRAR